MRKTIRLSILCTRPILDILLGRLHHHVSLEGSVVGDDNEPLANKKCCTAMKMARHSFSNAGIAGFTWLKLPGGVSPHPFHPPDSAQPRFPAKTHLSVGYKDGYCLDTVVQVGWPAYPSAPGSPSPTLGVHCTMFRHSFFVRSERCAVI